MAFNPDEPRGPGGKWIHLGAAIEKVAGLQKGKRTYVNGHVVRNLDQGYRVRINGVAKNYSSHEDAARAMHAGEHIGSTPEAAIRREASRANAPKTASTPEQVLRPRAPMAEATPSRGRGVTTQTLADEQRQREERRSAAIMSGERPNALDGSTAQMQAAMERGEITPRQVAEEMQRRSQIRQEAFNQARGGGLTVHSGPMGTSEQRGRPSTVGGSPHVHAIENARRIGTGQSGGYEPPGSKIAIKGLPARYSAYQTTKTYGKEGRPDIELVHESEGHVATLTHQGGGKYTYRLTHSDVVSRNEPYAITSKQPKTQSAVSASAIMHHEAAMPGRQRSMPEKNYNHEASMASLRERLREQPPHSQYTPEEIVDMRRADIETQLRAGDKFITVKVP